MSFHQRWLAVLIWFTPYQNREWFVLIGYINGYISKSGTTRARTHTRTLGWTVMIFFLLLFSHDIIPHGNCGKLSVSQWTNSAGGRDTAVSIINVLWFSWSLAGHSLPCVVWSHCLGQCRLSSEQPVLIIPSSILPTWWSTCHVFMTSYYQHDVKG